MKLPAAALALLMAAGCSARQGVLRVEDDAYVLGIAYEPAAYSYMLAGVLAENDGKPADAARAYQRALDQADDNPELQTRVYQASCLAAAPGRFDEKRARAKWLASAMRREYAPAYAALAACVSRQGAQGDAAALDFARAGLARTSRDPADVARAASGTHGALELRLDVLVTAHPESREAYLALGQSLERRGKYPAAAQAFAEYARRQPSDRQAMLAKAEAFAARNQGYAARLLAGAALDAPALSGAPLGTLPALGVRLGIDESLLRGDERATLRRASRGRVPLGEVAARAVLAGDAALGERLARAVLEAGGADPDAVAVLLGMGETWPARVAGTPSESGRRVLERAMAAVGVAPLTH